MVRFLFQPDHCGGKWQEKVRTPSLEAEDLVKKLL